MNTMIFPVLNAVSTKTDGSMKHSDGTIASENLDLFLANHQMPRTLYAMEQIHGGDVAVIKDNSEKFITGVDALITDKKNISLAVVTADCLPILLHDPQTNTIGVIHAGSKGLLKRIIAHTILALEIEFGTKPKDIVVTIGPAIETMCYEVSPSFATEFQKAFPDFTDIYEQKEDRYFLNLKNIALQSLQKAGILGEHITVSQECTKCSLDTYYSFRNGNKTDRFVSVISL